MKASYIIVIVDMHTSSPLGEFSYIHVSLGITVKYGLLSFTSVRINVILL